MRAGGVLALQRHYAGKHEVVGRTQLRLPTILDHHRLVCLDDDGGTGDLVARLELVARVHRSVVPGAAEKETRPSSRRGNRIGRKLGRFCNGSRPATESGTDPPHGVVGVLTLTAILTVLALFYLGYAMIRPEAF